MVSNVIEQSLFVVKVSWTGANGFENILSMRFDLSFMEAADYAIESQGYFRHAIGDQKDWQSVSIEIGLTGHGTIQLIEIQRETVTA